ncbi:MAG: transposase [Kiloniellales bacterium]
MARLARIVVPGLPHHVTQRGNRRQQTFFEEADYRAYLALMAEWCGHHEVAVWAYCLMPNHVHLIAVPGQADSLRRAIGEAHRRYTRRVNLREDWRGHLWQERFASFPLDGDHLLAAARYVELNPLRAGLAARPQDWPWSSAAAHLTGRDDALVAAAPLLEMVPDWHGLLDGGLSQDERETLRRHERTGRPLGGEGFVAGLEARLGRPLRPRKAGRKPVQREGEIGGKLPL